MSHIERNFAERIREEGYRFTPQRQLILDALCGMGRHASVEEIYERIQALAPSVSLATVYRTVNFLESLHLVVSAEIQGETVYEIAPPTPHHHLVCRECGKVVTLADYHLEGLVRHLVEEHHFHAEIEHLTITGLCGACRKATDSNRP
jgi:Fur family ferric uptake transcriptional regulator